jgi:hypothetical protein
MKGASIQEVYGNGFNVTAFGELSPFTIPKQTQPTVPDYDTDTYPLSYSYANVNDGFGFSDLDDDYETINPVKQPNVQTNVAQTPTTQMTPIDYLLHKVLNDEDCYKRLETHFQTKLEKQMEQKINDKIEQFALSQLQQTQSVGSDEGVGQLFVQLFQRILDFVITTDVIANLFVVLIVAFLFLIVIDLLKNVFK